MKIGKRAFWLIPLFCLSACMNVESTLKVADGQLLKFQDRGSSYVLFQGQYAMQLHLAEKSKDLSEINFPALQKKFSLSLPDVDVLLNVNEPLVLSAESLHQSFALEIRRVTDLHLDHYTISFLSEDRSQVIATANFDYKGNGLAFDDKNQEFLQSFQKVKHSQRGTVIPIDVDGVGNPILNHLAQVYIEPWIYARYAHVEWILGDDNHLPEARLRPRWEKILRDSPVVDLFFFRHGNSDIDGLNVSENLGWKKHQLRLFYTTGCESAMSDDFPGILARFNAAVVIGHRGNSASAFVGFPLIRFWTYGSSALDATKTGWAIGKTEESIVDAISGSKISQTKDIYTQQPLWKNRDDMVAGTEPGLGWTAEMPPEKLFIDQSAVVNRNDSENQYWHLSFAENKEGEKEGPLNMSENIFNPHVSVAGKVFTRDTSHPDLGAAYRDPQGLIWGDIFDKIMGDEGSANRWRLESLSLGQAKSYCTEIGARLPTKEEFELLRQDLGYGTELGYSRITADGSGPMLPNLASNFWTSTASTENNAAYSFVGTTGDIASYPTLSLRSGITQETENGVRCVMKESP